jgi:hypothetical protein
MEVESTCHILYKDPQRDNGSVLKKNKKYKKYKNIKKTQLC